MPAWVRRAIDVGLIAATCCMSMPTAGFGQERVRVTLPGETIVGVVTQLSPDALELVLPGGGSRVLSSSGLDGRTRSRDARRFGEDCGRGVEDHARGV